MPKTDMLDRRCPVRSLQLQVDGMVDDAHARRLRHLDQNLCQPFRLIDHHVVAGIDFVGSP